MKEYKGIVQSSTEPKIGFVWLKDSKLFYFSGNGWTQINEGVTLEEVITLLDRKLDTGTFNDTMTNIESEIVKLKKDISALQEQINNPKE